MSKYKPMDGKERRILVVNLRKDEKGVLIYEGCFVYYTSSVVCYTYRNVNGSMHILNLVNTTLNVSLV